MHFHLLRETVMSNQNQVSEISKKFPVVINVPVGINANFKRLDFYSETIGDADITTCNNCPIMKNHIHCSSIIQHIFAKDDLYTRGNFEHFVNQKNATYFNPNIKFKTYSIDELFCPGHGEYFRHAFENLPIYDSIELEMLFWIIIGNVQLFEERLKYWIDPFHHDSQNCIIIRCTQLAKKYKRLEILSLLSQVSCFQNHHLTI